MNAAHDRHNDEENMNEARTNYSHKGDEVAPEEGTKEGEEEVCVTIGVYRKKEVLLLL